ncbi:MAG: hypothetical protein ACYC7J_12295 [Syntrophales bacterium]
MNGSIRGRIASRLARVRFVREAMEEKADLSSLRRRPTPREWTGLGLVGFSYLIGWPAVGLLALLAYRMDEPLLLVIGGPAVYGFSHVVFWAGSWLAGARYAGVILRWAMRRIVEKLGGATAPPTVS